MNDWYRYYRAETNRRGDEIKAAEKYRLMKLVKNDPYGTPGPKIYHRLFSFLRNWLFHRGTPQNIQRPASPRLYEQEQP